MSDAVRRYLQQRKDPEALQPKLTEAKRSLLDLFEPLRGLDVEFTRKFLYADRWGELGAKRQRLGMPLSTAATAMEHALRLSRAT